MKTIVLGLGNPILRDDAIGLHVVRALEPHLAGCADIDIGEDHRGGLRLMERLIGYDRAIVVDAICTGAKAGVIHRLSSPDLPTQHSGSSHDMNLPMALEVGRRAGAHLPKNEDILIFGIEAEDVLTFGQELSPGVQGAVEAAVQAILAAIPQERWTT